jgi:hypothetical protein
MNAPDIPARQVLTGTGQRKFDKALHRTYFLAAGIHHFIARRVRPPGIALALVLVLATCLGVGHDRSSVYQLFSLSLGMLVIGIPWAMCRQARAEARRELPRFATAGEPLRYHIHIWHHGKKRLARAWLADAAPDPRPNHQDFTTLREPGEEERNQFDRCFAYFRWQWLLRGNRLFTGGIASEDLDLAVGQSARIPLEITPLRRGVIRFDDLRVLLPDPFGLFQRCRKVRAPAATLTVLPKRFRLPPIELPGGAAFRMSGEANSNAHGSTGEFMGLRDYRPGDSLRQIHWKSWARTGRPIVKELEDTFYPRYGLIVDTLSCEQNDEAFEETISVAASFAATLDSNESLLDLMFIKNQAHIVTAGRGLERAEKLLEVLAAVSPERLEKYDDLAKLVLLHQADLSSCLVIFNGWDEARAAFLRKLQHAGILCVPLIIGKSPGPAECPGHWLESGNIARDLLALPRALSA